MLTTKVLIQNTLIPSFQALSITDLLPNIREDCNYFFRQSELESSPL